MRGASALNLHDLDCDSLHCEPLLTVVLVWQLVVRWSCLQPTGQLLRAGLLSSRITPCVSRHKEDSGCDAASRLECLEYGLEKAWGRAIWARAGWESAVSLRYVLA